MKLDLIEIRKLSPPKLWNLAGVVALIVAVRRVISLGVGSPADVRRAVRMAAHYRRQLYARTLDNLNMRIKAWVMQCPDRIAEVRRVIGEAAIKRWNKNRLLDYAFTKAFGDWKAAFPDGVRGGLKDKEKTYGQGPQAKFMHKVRPYLWKPFALVKIDNTVRLLYGQSVSMPASGVDVEEKCVAYLKLWGVDIMDTEDGRKNTQPRRARPMKPVRFTPYELIAEAATGVPQDLVEARATPKLMCGETKIYPPSKPEKILPEQLISGQLLLKNDETEIEYKPP